MEKKKLVIFIPSIEGGGVEKNFFIIANYLSEKLKNVTVISTKFKDKNKLNKKIRLITPSSDFWTNRNRRLKYLVCLLLLIKLIFLKKNYTVFAFQANLYCVVVCKLLGNKILTRSNSAPAGWSKNLLKKFIYKKLLSKADEITVNSKAFKYKMKEYFNVKTTVIYNPLNKKEILKKSNIKVNKIFKHKKKLKIINIGRFVDQKDQITLLRALNFLKSKISFEAVIIGRGHLKSKLVDFLITNKLGSTVKILDFKKNPYPYLKQADLFILSSIYEGLPNVLLEALVLKKFVISSDCPTGPSEILLNGRGGLLFKTRNYKSLSNKIVFYKKNKKICDKLLSNSVKALNRFDYYNNLKKYFTYVKRHL